MVAPLSPWPSKLSSILSGWRRQLVYVSQTNKRCNLLVLILYQVPWSSAIRKTRAEENCRGIQGMKLGPYPFPASNRSWHPFLSSAVFVPTSNDYTTATGKHDIHHADPLDHNSAQDPTREDNLSSPSGDVDLIVIRRNVTLSPGTRRNKKQGSS